MLFGVEGLQVTDAQALPDGTLEVWAVTDYPASAACPDVSSVPSRQTGPHTRSGVLLVATGEKGAAEDGSADPEAGDDRHARPVGTGGGGGNHVEEDGCVQ